MTFLKRLFGKQTPAAQRSTVKQKQQFRWYFLSVGHAMGPETFRAVTQDDDFMSVGGGKGLASSKFRVRLYLTDSDASQSADAEAEFDGFGLSDGDKPKPIGSIREAYDALTGGSGGMAVIAILADRRFDDFYSRFGSHLNQQYVQNGALPIVTVIRTDDGQMADSLCECFVFEGEGKPLLAPAGELSFFAPS